MENNKTYEIAYLLQASEAERVIVDVLNQHKSEIFNNGELSEIKLAYPIKKQQSAHFGFIQFSANPESIEQIKFTLANEPQILRILVVSISEQTAKDQKIREKPPQQKKVEAEINPNSTDILSNEALEKKLEEILK